MAVPILELILLIEVGKKAGTWWVLALIVGTGVLGGALVTTQGYGVFKKAEKEINLGRIPKNQLIDAVLILVGGVLLVTPGLITDTIGLMLLFPLTRLPIRTALKRWIQQYIYINI